MCHCGLCQRRTGSAFHLAAWFANENVATIEGAEQTYYREGEAKIGMTFHFCPTCGSNVYWESKTAEGLIGVAVGCFADPDFPAPEFSIYGDCRHGWVAPPGGIPMFVKGRNGPEE
jgi:hypothetical protein